MAESSHIRKLRRSQRPPFTCFPWGRGRLIKRPLLLTLYYVSWFSMSLHNGNLFHLPVPCQCLTPRFHITNKILGREREKGIHVKMRVKLAAKLLVSAWTLMKKKEAFNPACLSAELNWIEILLIFDEKSPSNNVEAVKGPRGGQSRASRWTLESG